MDNLHRFRDERALVALRRDGVDDNKIQGFVLGASDDLVLLQYVYDFKLDGLMILRTKDVSEVERSKTEEFQQSLLEAEGLFADIPFGYAVDLTDLRSAIAGLSSRFQLLIAECELLEDPDFAIGRVLEVGAEEVALRYFTGAANWLDEPVRLRYEDITCCQVNTNYANVYQRYFERNAL